MKFLLGMALCVAFARAEDPFLEPTMAPRTPGTVPPAFASNCRACPEGQEITFPDLELPEAPIATTCGNIALVLLFIPPESDRCIAIQNEILEVCGCSVTVPSTTSPFAMAPANDNTSPFTMSPANDNSPAFIAPSTALDDDDALAPSSPPGNSAACLACPPGQTILITGIDIPDIPFTCSEAESALPMLFPGQGESDVCKDVQAVILEVCGCYDPTSGAGDDVVEPFLCTICPGGETVPDPSYVPFADPSTSNETCGFLQVIASFIVDPIQCAASFQSFGAALCGCESYVPPPDAICTTICSDGTMSPDPNAAVYVSFDAFGSPFNTTCGQLERIVSVGDLNDQVCDAFHYLGVNRCGCEDLLGAPLCSLCPDGEFPSYPIGLLANDTTCLEWAVIIWDEEDAETCSAFQDYAAQYCGCNPVEEQDVCRICGDTLLPYPNVFPSSEGEQDCGLIELESNLDKTLCGVNKAVYQVDCCEIEPPVFSPVMNPISIPTVSPIAFGPSPAPAPVVFQPVFNPAFAPDAAFTPFPTPSFNPPPFISPHFWGLVASPVDTSCTTVCLDDSPVPKPDDIAFVDSGGLEVTCGQLQALVENEDSLLSLDCDVVAYVGITICGCVNVLPEPLCEICEDGSAPPNPAMMLDNGISCAAAAVALANSADFPPDSCQSYQSTAGVYCGCQNPIASEGACRICGNSTLLPNPLLQVFSTNLGENVSCIEMEFNSFQNGKCEFYAGTFSAECCVAAVPPLTLLPTQFPTMVPETNVTSAPSMSPSGSSLPSASAAPTVDDSASSMLTTTAFAALFANIFLALLSYYIF
jgi:hypothetical protein